MADERKGLFSPLLWSPVADNSDSPSLPSLQLLILLAFTELNNPQGARVTAARRKGNICDSHRQHDILNSGSFTFYLQKKTIKTQVSKCSCAVWRGKTSWNPVIPALRGEDRKPPQQHDRQVWSESNPDCLNTTAFQLQQFCKLYLLHAHSCNNLWNDAGLESNSTTRRRRQILVCRFRASPSGRSVRTEFWVILHNQWRITQFNVRWSMCMIKVAVINYFTTPHPCFLLPKLVVNSNCFYFTQAIHWLWQFQCPCCCRRWHFTFLFFLILSASHGWIGSTSCFSTVTLTTKTLSLKREITVQTMGRLPFPNRNKKPESREQGLLRHSTIVWFNLHHMSTGTKKSKRTPLRKAQWGYSHRKSMVTVCPWGGWPLLEQNSTVTTAYQVTPPNSSGIACFCALATKITLWALQAFNVINTSFNVLLKATCARLLQYVEQENCMNSTLLW